MIEHLELSLDELLLDLDNPRLDSTSSQSEEKIESCNVTV